LCKKLRSEIGKILGSRGAKKINKIKKNTVPSGDTFTPAQTKRMIADSKILQDDDTERAGQSLD